jgi:hypothetical protein
MIVDEKHPFAYLYNHGVLPARKEILEDRQRGRRKGSPNEKTVLKKLLSRKHTSQETGETCTILEWILLMLKKKVVGGDFAAIRVYEEFFGSLFNSPEGNDRCGVLMVPQTMTNEEWIKMAEEENALTDRYHHAKLEET